MFHHALVYQVTNAHVKLVLLGARGYAEVIACKQAVTGKRVNPVGVARPWSKIETIGAGDAEVGLLFFKELFKAGGVHHVNFIYQSFYTKRGVKVHVHLAALGAFGSNGNNACRATNTEDGERRRVFQHFY